MNMSRTKQVIATALLALIGFVLPAGSAVAQQIKVQVTGLFMPEREQDLREVVAEIPDVKLVSVDFKKAEATFEVDAKKFGKPEQAVQKLDSLVKSESRSTFGIKPLSKTPTDKLKLIEIPVAGLDCKACSLAAYEAVYRLDG